MKGVDGHPVDAVSGVRKIIGLGIAAAVIVGGALFVGGHREASPDRQAIYKACMAAIPDSSTSFDAIQTCVDKANAAR